jgi:hypothetical protein
MQPENPSLLLVAFVLCVASVIGGLIVALVSVALLLRRLRQAHANVWVSLGSPSLFGTLVSRGLSQETSNLKTWLWRGGDWDLRDPKVARLAKVSKASLVIFASGVCFALAVGLYRRFAL